MAEVVSVVEQNGYGAFKRGEHCCVHENPMPSGGIKIGNWRATYDDGTVAFFCEEHAPEPRTYSPFRCDFPGCLQADGRAPKLSNWLEPDGGQRCQEHHLKELPMRTEIPTGPWEQYTCDLGDDNEAVQLAKVDGGWELRCAEHAGWRELAAQYPDQQAAIAAMKAEGYSQGAITAFATLHNRWRSS